MNINSPQEWLALIISSAGTSAAINIAWSAWTRHKDKTHDRNTEYVNLSDIIEGYIQNCLDKIDYEETLFSINHDPEPQEVNLKPVKTPDFSEITKATDTMKEISPEIRSKIKETLRKINKIEKESNPVIEKSIREEWADEYTLDFLIQKLTAFGIEARKIAEITRNESGTESAMLLKYVDTLEKIKREQVTSKIGKAEDELIPYFRSSSYS